MGEALITRQGGINSEMAGSIEDILLKDSAYGTVLVTLRDPDSTPIVGQTIKMTDHGGISINYTTNEKGQCLFKTQTGQMTINDRDFVSNFNYIDMMGAEDRVVDCPVGSVSKINLVRRIRGNGYSINITSSRWANFSRLINTIDIFMSGGGGSGAPVWSYKSVQITAFGSRTGSEVGTYQTNWYFNNPTYNGFLDITTGVYFNQCQNGGNGYTNSAKINPNGNYYITIGKGGSRASASFKTRNCKVSNPNYGSFQSNSSTRFNFNINARTSSGNADISSNNKNNLTGRSGETTTFGSILSALGGSGGSFNSNINYPNADGGNGAKGGSKQATFTISSLYAYSYQEDGYGHNYECIINGNVFGSTGTQGWCYLSNFQYKI